MRELSLSFGAMSPSFEEQLQLVGMTLGDSAAHYQRAADSATYLRVHGLITDSACDSVRKKIMKEIAKAVKQVGVVGQGLEVGGSDVNA